MVFDNTPPVSPREPVDDSDDEIGDNEEIVEVESYDGDDIEELYAGVDGLESGEEEEDEEDEEMNREPVEDQSVAIFDKHSGNIQQIQIFFKLWQITVYIMSHRFSLLLSLGAKRGQDSCFRRRR